MAIIKGHPLKGNIQKAIDYIIKEVKVAKGCIETNNVNIYTAGIEWDIKRNEGIKLRRKSSFDEVVGHHFVQSFPIGSITPEEAFDIANEWAKELFANKYDYVISTHKDKEHIHSHIIINSTNNVTKKNMDIYYKRDLQIFKNVSDEICVKHNKEILEKGNKKYGYTYYEWLMNNKGDSHKTIVAKAIDATIPKVKNINELKMYLEAQGFEVETGEEKKEEHGHVSMKNYKFSVNEKMVNPTKETDFFYYVRIPYSKVCVYIPKENCIWATNNKTMFIEINNKTEYESYDPITKLFSKKTMDDISQHFEDKGKELKGRQGLRIKPPNANKFIRCNRININEEGEGYSINDVIQRIENNGRYITDPEIEKIIKRNYSSEEKKKNKEQFFDEAGIKENFYTSKFNQMTSYEKFIYIKMNDINEMLREIRTINHKIAHPESMESLSKQKAEIIRRLDEINKISKNKEDAYVELLNQQMEGLLAVTEEQKEEYIETYIKPLRNARGALKDELSSIQQKIKEKEIDNKINR